MPTKPIAAPVHRSGRPPSRAVAPPPSVLVPGKRGRRSRSTMRPDRRYGGWIRRSLHRRAPIRQSGQWGRGAPPVGLTLRAIWTNSAPHLTLSRRQSCAFASLGVGLALAWCAGVADADSSGAQYTDSLPTATGTSNPPTHSAPERSKPEGTAHAASVSPGTHANGGAADTQGSGGSNDTVPAESPTYVETPPPAEAIGEYEGAGAKSAPAGGKLAPQPAVDGGEAVARSHPRPEATSGDSGASAESGSDSSPWVPIVTALAVLAFASIAAVAIRAHRHRQTAPRITPKAS